LSGVPSSVTVPVAEPQFPQPAAQATTATNANMRAFNVHLLGTVPPGGQGS
jgi:hypothetical protein